jgi:5-methylcytosine-specific restriction endonuclease McrA
MDTLILNRDGSPISLLPLSAVSWQEAIKYICLDRVDVLEWYDDWIVRSATWETKVPAVIMVKDFIKKRSSPRLSKFNVIMRDRFQCQYCSIPVSVNTVTMDHVLPISKGGQTSWSNLVASCQDCNSRKGSKLWKPKNAPYAPSYYELVNIRKELPFNIRHPSWKDYLQ